MHWIDREELSSVNMVNDLNELLQVMLDDNLTEFQYVIEDNVIEGKKWKIILN